MRIFLTFALFFLLQAASLAQIAVSLPPARPLTQLPDTATILIMGDVMMHRDQISNSARPDGQYDFSTYFTHIGDVIKDADLAVANMEFTLAGKPYSGYPCFSAPDGYEDYVASMGVDVFLMANNHILDKGKSGLERTLSRYGAMEDAGVVKFTGVSVTEEDDRRRFPLVMAVRGTRVALINFTYGTNIKGDGGYPKVHLTDKEEIEAAVLSALEQTPPELYQDIVHNGIFLTGGGALLRGLDRRLTDKIGIEFHVAEDPLHAVAKGTGIALKNIKHFKFLMR